MRHFLLILLLSMPLGVLNVNVCFAAKKVKTIKRKKKKKIKLARSIEKKISTENRDLDLLLKDLDIEINAIEEDIISLRLKIQETKKKAKRKNLHKILNKKLEDHKLLNLKVKAIKRDLKIAIVNEEDYLDSYVSDYEKESSDNSKKHTLSLKDVIKKEKKLNTFLNISNIPKVQKEALILLIKQIRIFAKGNKPELKRYLHSNIIDSINKIASICEDTGMENVKKRVLVKQHAAIIKKNISYGLQIGVYKNLNLYGSHSKREARIFLRQDIDGNMYKYTLGPFDTFESAVKFRRILKRMGLFITNPDIVPLKKDTIVDYDESIEKHIRENKVK